MTGRPVDGKRAGASDPILQGQREALRRLVRVLAEEPVDHARVREAFWAVSRWTAVEIADGDGPARDFRSMLQHLAMLLDLPQVAYSFGDALAIGQDPRLDGTRPTLVAALLAIIDELGAEKRGSGADGCAGRDGTL